MAHDDFYKLLLQLFYICSKHLSLAQNNRQARYKINRTTLRIIYGNLTDQNTEVWVSSDDDHLSMTGGVSRAIRQVAGESIYVQNRTVVPLPVGRVALTGAGEAASKGVKHIFHPAIIKLRARSSVKASTIESVVQRSLELCDVLGARTISFPAIGTGSAKAAFELVAEAMMRTITTYLKQNTGLREVRVVLFFKDDAQAVYINELFEKFGREKATSEQKERLDTLVTDLGKSMQAMSKGKQNVLIKDIQSELKQVGQVESTDKFESLIHNLDSVPLPPTSATAAAPSVDLDALRIKMLRTRLEGIFLILNLHMAKLNELEIAQAVEGAAFGRMPELVALKEQIFNLQKEAKNIELELKNLTKPMETPHRDALSGDVFNPVSQPTVTGGRTFLLLISIDDYTDFNKLNNAKRDARALKDVLIKHYGFEEQHIREFFDTDATRSKVNRALGEMSKEGSAWKLQPDDRLVIFYSGHGHYDKRLDEGYWFLSDAVKDDDTTYFDNTKLIKQINAINNRHTVVIADACFSGALVRDAGTGERAINRLEAMNSRWAIVSGRLEEVSDGRAGDHSPFMKALLDHLKNPIDPVFTTEELAAHLKRKVGNNAEQLPEGRPILKAGDEGGQFIWRKDGVRVTDSTPPAQPSHNVSPTTTPPTTQPITGAPMYKQQIEQAIADFDLDQVLAILKSIPNTHARYDNILQMQGRINRFKRDSTSGTMTDDQRKRDESILFNDSRGLSKLL
jgi:O-acetyl-ADP-ribose deacetylase (regulator of RNase III)